MRLAELPMGKSGRIGVVGGGGALRQHFLDMGLIPGCVVTAVKAAPMGDPLEFRVHGYELTLRKDDAANIEVEPCEDDSPGPSRERRPHSSHPGLGEGGKFHAKGDGDPLPEGERLTFALVGNQNCGKTTLFNALTGSNQHVGNFPGVTVDRKDGVIKGRPNTLVTDLPGIYSLSPYSSEELVTRAFVLGQKPRGIINIVDASNMERNLYLTMQLIELDIPMVVALNMMDEVRENGGSVRINEMEEMLGVPVVAISAAKKEGLAELVDHAVHVARYQERPRRKDFCPSEGEGAAVHRSLHAIMHLIEDHAEKAGVPLRFAASKLAEGDLLVKEALGLDENERETLAHIISQMESEGGMDRSALMAKMRFNFIGEVCSECVVKPKESKESARSARADRILTGKWTAIPCFVLIMLAVFWLTFDCIGLFLQDWLDGLIGSLGAAADSALAAWNVNWAVRSLVVDGIFAGVGSVLSFLPVIVVMFLFLSLLEDSGYMARVAFVMDKPLRKIGLSGRSIVPMLVGFGCTVPGVMATRTLPSERDRKLTILLTPFMSCSAKMPIYGFIASVFFPGRTGLVMTAMYALGIVMGVLSAWALKKTAFKGEAAPFVMELPNYRMPGIGNVARLLWEKAKDFLQRAFTVIFLATIVIWFLQTFDFRFQRAPDSSESALAVVAAFVAPALAPIGLGDWRVATALITGFLAKESVVSTMSMLFGSTAALAAALPQASAVALLVFCLLYTPCVAAIASIKRELGGRWAFGVVVAQCLVAWVAALVARLLWLGLFG